MLSQRNLKELEIFEVPVCLNPNKSTFWVISAKKKKKQAPELYIIISPFVWLY